jgi:hypothetical protein
LYFLVTRHIANFNNAKLIYHSRVGLVNFFDIYKDITDKWIVYDNSYEIPVAMAKGNASLVSYIYNYDLWEKFNSYK